MSYIQNMKLRPSLYDRLFRKDRFKEIIELRTQITFMCVKFEEYDIWKRIGQYDEIYIEFMKLSTTTLNEVSMCYDKGEQAVIDRLISDRDKLFNLLSPIEELGIESIARIIREEKLKTVIDD